MFYESLRNDFFYHYPSTNNISEEEKFNNMFFDSLTNRKIFKN